MVQHEPCSIGRAMEVLGERWTFLIVREAFFGVRRFTELQRNLGIARNILSARLQTLTRAGILEKIRYQQEPERYEYKLTAMGRDLYPAIVAIMRWGDEYLAGDEGPPLLLCHQECGHHADADDGLQPLRRAARPAQGDPRAGARRARRYRFAPMSVQDTTTELWGGETRKAVDNFPVSGERVPVPVVRWLGRIKGAAARVNADLGLLDADLAERIADAGDEIAEGKHDDQFPIDVFQTGSGTSSNMNANEVIANLAGEGAHPNDHVNMGQSSNDVFPSAVHLAALDQATNTLLPALEQLEASLQRQGRGVRRPRQVRPHAPDGRGAGHARPGVRRLRRADPPRRASASRNALPQVAQIPLGGTATGTGLNTHPEFAGKVREKLAADTGLEIHAARGPVRGAGQPRRARRAVRRAEGDRRLADQDRQRPRADGLRPARRHRRDLPARAAEGLVDHARQGQPGDARGRAPGLRAGDRQRHRDHRSAACRASSSSTCASR